MPISNKGPVVSKGITRQRDLHDVRPFVIGALMRQGRDIGVILPVPMLMHLSEQCDCACIL